MDTLYLAIFQIGYVFEYILMNLYIVMNFIIEYCNEFYYRISVNK